MAADKNYLGLGIIFEGVDKGFDDSIQDAIKSSSKAESALVSLKESVKDVGKSTAHAVIEPEVIDVDFEPILGGQEDIRKAFLSTGKTKDWLIKNFGKYQLALNSTEKSQENVSKSSKGIGSAFASLGQSIFSMLGPLSNLLTGSGKVGDLAKTLDSVGAKMSLVMNPAQVSKFNAGMTGLVRNFGLTGDEAKTVAMTLNQFGTPVEKSLKMMSTMGKLIGPMGMDAGQVAKMFGMTSQRLGMSAENMNGLVSEVYSLGQAQGFVDFLEDLPEVVEGVTESFNKMGIMNESVAKSSIKSTMQLSAMYRKMGVDQKTAIAAATKVQKATSQMVTDIRRLKVGLEPENFEGLIDVASEMSRVSGMTMQDTLDLMMQGPEAAQKKMMDVAKTLSGDDLFRFAEVMRKQFGDEFANALVNPDMRASADAAGKVIAKTGVAAAKEMDKATSVQANTLQYQEKLLSANKELVEALGQLAAKMGIMKSWGTQIETLRGIQDSIIKQDFAGKMYAIAEAFKAGGASAVSFAAGLETIGGILGNIGTWSDRLMKFIGTFAGILAIGPIIRGVTGAFSSFGTIAGKSLGFIGRFIKPLSVFGKVAAKFLGPIGAALGFVSDGMDAIKEKSVAGGIGTLLFGKDGGSGMDIAKNVGSQALKWGGVGATIGTFIAPGIGTAIGGAIGGAFGAAGALVKQYWTPIVDWISSTLGSIWEKTKGAWEGFKKWISSAWSSLWSGLSSTGSSLWDGIKSGWEATKKFLIESWGTLVNKVKEVFQIITNALSSPTKLLSGVVDFFKPGASSTEKEQTLKASPISNQPEAPAISRVPSYKPEFSAKKSGNTLDDVVAVLSELTNMMGTFTQQQTQPVQVVLQGDAKKFFKVASSEAMDRAGALGLQNQVVGVTR